MAKCAECAGFVAMGRQILDDTESNLRHPSVQPLTHPCPTFDTPSRTFDIPVSNLRHIVSNLRLAESNLRHTVFDFCNRKRGSGNKNRGAGNKNSGAGTNSRFFVPLSEKIITVFIVQGFVFGESFNIFMGNHSFFGQVD